MSKERLQRKDKVDEMGSMDEAFKKFDERMDESEKQAIARGQKIAYLLNAYSG